MTEQIKILKQWNIQNVSSKYRLSLNGIEWFLMWRSFVYTQSFAQQWFGVWAQARSLRMWFIIKRVNWMINSPDWIHSCRFEAAQLHLFLLHFSQSCASLCFVGFKIKQWCLVKMLKTKVTAMLIRQRYEYYKLLLRLVLWYICVTRNLIRHLTSRLLYLIVSVDINEITRDFYFVQYNSETQQEYDNKLKVFIFCLFM